MCPSFFFLLLSLITFTSAALTRTSCVISGVNSQFHEDCRAASGIPNDGASICVGTSCYFWLTSTSTQWNITHSISSTRVSIQSPSDLYPLFQNGLSSNAAVTFLGSPSPEQFSISLEFDGIWDIALISFHATVASGSCTQVSNCMSIQVSWTDELGHTFVRSDWSHVTSSNPFTWDMSRLSPTHILSVSKLTLSFTKGSGGSVVALNYITIAGRPPPLFIPTLAPIIPSTTSPTSNPSESPTQSPSLFVSGNTTLSPSRAPSSLPSTSLPTWSIIRNKTVLATGDGLRVSSNLVPLRLRNLTYSNYVPASGSLCLDCFILWADTDAMIQALDEYGRDCSLETRSTSTRPSPVWLCEGRWRLVSTTRLARIEPTYIGVRVYEMDERGHKYLQSEAEFEVTNGSCRMREGRGNVSYDCEVLPLTGRRVDMIQVEFMMAKRLGDGRKHPLIITWFDIFGVGYSLRPVLNASLDTLPGYSVVEGSAFPIFDLAREYYTVFVGILALGGAFGILLLIGCVTSQGREKKEDLFVDTRNIRTVFIDRRARNDAHRIVKRDEFNCLRHGPYFCIVLGMHLIYMVVFTVTFFCVVFARINATHFAVLHQYRSYAKFRDGNLFAISHEIEDYYANETDRMSSEIEELYSRCVGGRSSAMADAFTVGSRNQSGNHTSQMELIENARNLSQVSQSPSLVVVGETACSRNTSAGAVILERGPITVYSIQNQHANNVDSFSNATVSMTWRGSDFDRSNVSRFAVLSNFLDDRCESLPSCVGWTFVDGLSNYFVLSALGDPVASRDPGHCVVLSKPSLEAFTSIEQLKNYTAAQNERELANYQTEVGRMSSTLNQFKASLQSFENSNKNIRVVYVNKPNAPFGITPYIPRDLTVSTTPDFHICCVILEVNCPNCPSSNFSSPILHHTKVALADLNATQLEDYLSNASAANITGGLNVSSPLVDLPSIPNIFDLGLNFHLPNMSWIRLLTYTLIFDGIIWVFRCYRLVRKLAQICRGKDVQVPLKFLRTDDDSVSVCCASDLSCADNCYDCIIACTEKLKHCSYYIFEFILYFFSIFFIGGLILILYLVLSSALTIDYLQQLGTFSMMTVGARTHRLLRNQALSATAAGHNRVSVSTYVKTLQGEAVRLNAAAFEHNVREVQRVNEFNQLYCTSFTAYMESMRDVSVEGSILATTNEAVSLVRDTPGLWQSQNTRDEIEFELPRVVFGDLAVGWIVKRVVLDYRFDAVSQRPPIMFDILVSRNSTNFSVILSGEEIVVSNASQSQSRGVSVTSSESVKLRLVFSNLIPQFVLTHVAVFGSVPREKVQCDHVKFHPWVFDASVATADCPEITPVQGIMFRGFSSSGLMDTLVEQHTPFLRAARNIALSPFLLLLVGIGILTGLYLFRFGVEWFLMRTNLFRTNYYAKLPLVTYDSDSSEFDSDFEERERRRRRRKRGKRSRKRKLRGRDSFDDIGERGRSVRMEQYRTDSPRRSHFDEGNASYTPRGFHNGERQSGFVQPMYAVTPGYAQSEACFRDTYRGRSQFDERFGGNVSRHRPSAASNRARSELDWIDLGMDASPARSHVSHQSHLSLASHMRFHGEESNNSYASRKGGALRPPF